MMKMLLATLFFLSLASVNAIWIGEEFWTIVNYDGSLYGGRSTRDFIQFADSSAQEFVAYWIYIHGDTQFEAYGEAFLVGHKVCARFINETDQVHEICGGFRVLSNSSRDGSNPFEWRSFHYHADVVEYLNHQVARIWSKDRVDNSFGGAHLDRRLAYASTRDGLPLHLGRDNNAEFFDTHVELLTVRAGYHPFQDYPTGPRGPVRRVGKWWTPDDLLGNYRVEPPRPQVAPLDRYPTIECRDPRYDTDNDGYIDTKELHACQLHRRECPYEIYDVNRNGFLDSDELHKCRVDRGLDDTKYPTIECRDPRYDTNNDGYIDTHELNDCQHHRRECPLDIYDANNDGHLDAEEIQKCRNERDISSPSRRALHHPFDPRECTDPRYDTNGDGYIDTRERHACQYYRRECRLDLYDANNDGILDYDEVHKCRKARGHDISTKYCNSPYFDLNNDGQVDSYELDRCLKEHGARLRRHYRHAHPNALDNINSEEMTSHSETHHQSESESEDVVVETNEEMAHEKAEETHSRVENEAQEDEN